MSLEVRQSAGTVLNFINVSTVSLCRNKKTVTLIVKLKLEFYSCTFLEYCVKGTSEIPHNITTNTSHV